MRSAPFLRVLDLALRWHVALSMFVYGIAKTVQFAPTSTVSAPTNTLSGQELMWAFYGFSVGYVKFLGVVEMTGAVLLVFHRTKLLGCLILTSVLVNVITQDIVYHVNEGALRAACIYQGAIIVILVLAREQVKSVWKAVMAPPPRSELRWYWSVIGAVAVLAVTLLMEHVITH